MKIRPSEFEPATKDYLQTTIVPTTNWAKVGFPPRLNYLVNILLN